MIPKLEKMYQMNTKCTEWAYMYVHIPNVSKIGIPNEHKIHMSTFSNLRPSKFFPNWDFWFENKPSGNPGDDQLPSG
jgi:hypothetical protein